MNLCPDVLSDLTLVCGQAMSALSRTHRESWSSGGIQPIRHRSLSSCRRVPNANLRTLTPTPRLEHAQLTGRTPSKQPVMTNHIGADDALEASLSLCQNMSINPT